MEALSGDLLDHDPKNENTSKCCIHDEQKEVLVIVHTNTVSDPGAVMVHSRDTFAAHRAVVRPRWSKASASDAVTPENEIVITNQELVLSFLN